MRQIVLVAALALLLVSVSRGNTEEVEQTLGFSKKCEYHINEMVHNLQDKMYVGAYIHSAFVYAECKAYTDEERDMLDKIHAARNKLMEEY